MPTDNRIGELLSAAQAICPMKPPQEWQEFDGVEYGRLTFTRQAWERLDAAIRNIGKPDGE